MCSICVFDVVRDGSMLGVCSRAAQQHVEVSVLKINVSAQNQYRAVRNPILEV
jgi:hypothetical protein